MINIDALKSFFPKQVQGNRKDMLREYLQCLLLEIIFDSPLGKRLTFIGGTCLRIVHDSQRFSEDLNFDNDGLTEAEFAAIKPFLEKELSQRGYETEVEIRGKTAYRCMVKYPSMLFEHGLASQPEQKLLIQIDTQAQGFHFKPKIFILNRLGAFAQISVTPLDVIFSQKCYAVLNRPRSKGRDFFDLIFLLGMNVKPNYDYLKLKKDIANSAQLKEAIIAKWQTLQPEEMVADVEGFLFNTSDRKKILLFGEIFKNANL